MIATRQTSPNAPALPAWHLSGGFVTETDIRKHGSYAAARRAKDKERGTRHPADGPGAMSIGEK